MGSVLVRPGIRGFAGGGDDLGEDVGGDFLVVGWFGVIGGAALGEGAKASGASSSKAACKGGGGKGASMQSVAMQA